MTAVTLSTALREVKSIPAARLRQLQRFEMHTVGDLLHHFPHRYEDRTTFDRFPTDESATAVCLCGRLVKAGRKRFGRRQVFEATLEEEIAGALSSPIICRWFNAYWVANALAVGQRVVVYGRSKRRGSQVVIDHPEFEVIEDDAEVSIHLRRIVPIHKATEGLTPRTLRGLIWNLLAALPSGAVPLRIPPELDAMDPATALREIHFPSGWPERDAARRHWICTEFFALQLELAARRASGASAEGAVHAGPDALMSRLHALLPFPLTKSQQRAIAEIRRDLAAPHPMNRLLHGDVGAGKTIVALSAMLLAVEMGYQAALMAPTQILAEQHYLSFRRLLAPLEVGLALRTGARKEDTTLPLFDAAGSRIPERSLAPAIIVGTHALLYEGTAFDRLGLIVIDEQHKFGVLQRAKLREQAAASADGIAPDVLVMTATPIPRTLTMTLYGDLDVSTLDELPKNRGKIITAVRDRSKLNDAAAFLRTHLEAGRQAYIVYPLIDESERLEARAAAAEYEKWKELLAPHACELLHGRTPAEQKERIMERFRRGEIKALIATTVIEVGIDVPNANIMLIEDAERFGLAQLHQLRGRVGRGEHKSYCILLTASKEEEALEKLRVLEQTTNGFEIAEEDLRMRKSGDLLGSAQSGDSAFQLGDWLEDSELMRAARQAAFAIIERDPALARPEHAAYRSLLVDRPATPAAGV